MTTRTAPQDPLADLLAQLEAAVRSGDRDRAARLESQIRRLLAATQDDLEKAELRVRELMGRLGRRGIGDGSGLESLGRTRGLPSRRTRDREPSDRDVGDFDAEVNVGGMEVRSPGEGSYGVPGEGRPAEAEGVVYPVWFGTNRKPGASGAGFTGERNDRVTRGRVDVRVPKGHRFGETGNPFWKRLLRLDLRDDRLRIERLERLEPDAFFAEIGAAMERARQDGEAAHALFFLHGFNVSFEEAAIRAAQIGYDLKVPGATAFFSWPSRGNVVSYTADEASIEASERAITDFLVEFAARCGAEKVHVLAHSMGNRGFLRCLQRIAANAETRGKVRLGQIFLAAPDVDRDLFLDLAHLYAEHGERTTLYASAADLPVHLSATWHDAPRAGYFLPHCVAPGVDTIAVPDFDIDLLGHSFFAQAEALLHDIHDLIRHGEAPSRRQRLQSALHEGAAYWQLGR